MYKSLLEKSLARYEAAKANAKDPPVPYIDYAKIDQHPQKDEIKTFIKREVLKETPEPSTAINSDICDDCGTHMIVIANDSMLACSRCGKTRLITTVHAWNVSMDADYSAVNVHQKSRLLEWLECAQAKEYGDIPETVLKDVFEALLRNKLTGLEHYVSLIQDEYSARGPFLSVSDALKRLPNIPDLETKLKHLDPILIRNVLRTCTSAETKKYGERSAKISTLLSGYIPERLTADQEEYIRKLFMAASPVYDRFKKPSQPNWPGGYAYFLRCLLILLGWDEIAAHFPIQLTGRNADREEMRAKIWAILEWENVPSVPAFSKVRLLDGTILDGSLVLDADKKCKIVSRGYEEMLQ
jgi:hypothetical protein